MSPDLFNKSPEEQAAGQLALANEISRHLSSGVAGLLGIMRLGLRPETEIRQFLLDSLREQAGITPQQNDSDVQQELDKTARDVGLAGFSGRPVNPDLQSKGKALQSYLENASSLREERQVITDIDDALRQQIDAHRDLRGLGYFLTILALGAEAVIRQNQTNSEAETPSLPSTRGSGFFENTSRQVAAQTPREDPEVIGTTTVLTPRDKTTGPSRPRSVYAGILQSMGVDELPEGMSIQSLARSIQAAVRAAGKDDTRQEDIKSLLSDALAGKLDPSLLISGGSPTPLGKLVESKGVVINPRTTSSSEHTIYQAASKTDATIRVVDLFNGSGVDIAKLGLSVQHITTAIRVTGTKSGLINTHDDLAETIRLFAERDADTIADLLAHASPDSKKTLLKLVEALKLALPENPTPVAIRPQVSPTQNTRQTETDFSRRQENPFPALTALLTTDDNHSFVVDGRHSLTEQYLRALGREATRAPKGKQGTKRRDVEQEQEMAYTSLSHELNALDQMGTKYETIDAMLKRETSIPRDVQKLIRWAEIADLPPAAFKHLKIILSERNTRPTNPRELKRKIKEKLGIRK